MSVATDCGDGEKKTYTTSGHYRFNKLKIIFSTKFTEEFPNPKGIFRYHYFRVLKHSSQLCFSRLKDRLSHIPRKQVLSLILE